MANFQIELWKCRVNTLRSFIDRYHKLPSSRDTYDSIKIGEWLHNQRIRHNKGLLLDMQVKLLNEVNPFWNATNGEKIKENKRLLLSSDWHRNVPAEGTPIDKYYTDTENLYECLKREVYDCESLIKQSKEMWVKSSLTHFDLMECYACIMPYVEPAYLELLLELNGDERYTWIDVTRQKSYVESFGFMSKEDMKARIDKVLDTLEANEKRAVIYRHALDGGKVKTYEAIAKLEGTSKQYARDVYLKGMRKFRHPFRFKNLYNMGGELDCLMLSCSTKKILYNEGIDTLYKYFDLVTDENIFAAFENNYAESAKEINEEKDKFIKTLYIRINTDINASDDPSLDTTINIIDLDLSVRAKNALINAGFNTIADMYIYANGRHIAEALLQIKGLGKKCVDEIRWLLEDINKNKHLNKPHPKKRFRTETFIGAGVRDAEEVLKYEIFECRNWNIFNTLKAVIFKNTRYGQKLSSIQWELLRKGTTEYTESQKDAIVKNILHEIRLKTGRNIKYLLWLADIEAVTDKSLYGRYLRNNTADMYNTGNLVIADSGKYGALYGYEKIPMPIKSERK